MCHEAEAVAHARGARDDQVLVLGQKRGGLGVHAVDDVHGAGLQRGGPLVCIADVDQFHTVEVAAVGLPVVTGLALEGGTHAGLELVERECAGSIGFAVVLEAIGYDDDVVVAEVERQVHIALAHGDLHLRGRQLLDVFDVSEQRLGGRLGLAAVHVQRVDDVIRVQGFAGGEGDAFAHIESPVRRAGLDVPAFKQFADRVAVVGHFNQVVPEHQAHRDRDRVRVGQRIQAIGGRTAFHAHAQGSALFCSAGTHQGLRGRGDRTHQTQSGSAGENLTAVQDDSRFSLVFEVCHMSKFPISSINDVPNVSQSCEPLGLPEARKFALRGASYGMNPPYVPSGNP